MGPPNVRVDFIHHLAQLLETVVVQRFLALQKGVAEDIDEARSRQRLIGDTASPDASTEDWLAEH